MKERTGTSDLRCNTKYHFASRQLPVGQTPHKHDNRTPPSLHREPGLGPLRANLANLSQVSEMFSKCTPMLFTPLQLNWLQRSAGTDKILPQLVSNSLSKGRKNINLPELLCAHSTALHGRPEDPGIEHGCTFPFRRRCKTQESWSSQGKGLESRNPDTYFSRGSLGQGSMVTDVIIEPSTNN